MAQHRVPMLGAALRRRGDPHRSRGKRVRALVTALESVEGARAVPGPRPQFRAELRAQLVAVTPRLVREGEAATSVAAAQHATPQADRHPTPQPARRARVRIARPLALAAGAFAVLVVLLGGAVTLSRHALPGDALYSLKRASEDTQYSLTGGPVARGRLKLEFAGRRIGEVAALLPRASALAAGAGPVAGGAAVNATTAAQITDTLASADGDVRTAAQLLGAAAVRGHTAAPLGALTSWAPGKISAMTAIVERLPAGGLRRDAVATRTLIAAAGARAAALQQDLPCGCLGSTGTDQLGPLPCAGACAPATTAPGGARSGSTGAPSGTAPGSGQPGGTTPGGAGAPATGGASGAGTGGSGAGTGGSGRTSGSAGTGAGAGTSTGSPGTGGGVPGLPLPSLPLPSLPLPSLSLPSVSLPTSLPAAPERSGSPSPLVSVGSCGLGVQLGPIGASVGPCSGSGAAGG